MVRASVARRLRTKAYRTCGGTPASQSEALVGRQRPSVPWLPPRLPPRALPSPPAVHQMCRIHPRASARDSTGCSLRCLVGFFSFVQKSAAHLSPFA